MSRVESERRPVRGIGDFGFVTYRRLYFRSSQSTKSSLPSLYQISTYSAIYWWVSAFASSELHGYYEHAEKQLITLAALAAGCLAGGAVSWVAGNENHEATGAM